MAQSDLDTMPTGKRQAAAAVTAENGLVGFGESVVDTGAKARAAAAGVRYAAFINYDVALDAYAARADVESLARKNARDNPNDFKDASFMRTVSGNVGSGSAA